MADAKRRGGTQYDLRLRVGISGCMVQGAWEPNIGLNRGRRHLVSVMRGRGQLLSRGPIGIGNCPTVMRFSKQP